MAKIQKKSLNAPDETTDLANSKLEMAKLEGISFARTTFKPGWRWSTHVKPVAKTESCQVTHMFYQVSGITHVRMNDGTEMEFGPGDVGLIPPGHDGWVVGDKPSVAINVMGMAASAKPKTGKK